MSTPIQLILSEEWGRAIVTSIVYGAICAVIFVVLIPLTRINWVEMRLPDFKVWELSVTRNSTILSAVFLVLCYLFATPWLNRDAASLAFILMLVAYMKIKGHSFLFREFYNAAERARLLKIMDTPDDVQRPASKPEEEKAPAGARQPSD